MDNELCYYTYTDGQVEGEVFSLAFAIISISTFNHVIIIIVAVKVINMVITINVIVFTR